MSHVDEGALHAYLDGALEEYPTGEARRIRAHLERCDVCAKALADARKVRDEAESLLAIPNVDVSAPPLEELRTLARSASESRTAPTVGVRLYRFGWAASVVLALGVGWMLRGGMPEDSGPQVAGAMSRSDGPVAEQEAPGLADEASAAATPERAQAGASADMGSPGPAPDIPTPRQDTRVAEAVLAEPTPATLPEVDVVAGELAYARPGNTEESVERLPEMAMEADPDVAAAPMAIPAVMPDEQVEMEADIGTAVLAEATVADTPVEVTGDDVPASPERSSLAARSAGVSSALQVESFALPERASQRVNADEASEPGSLVVPGLEVVSIVWREEGVVPAGVRVLQRLGDGGALELIHLPAGFDPGAVEAAEPGVGELVVPRDQGWLIMRGPLSEEEFRSMLERMDSTDPE